jgi:hypothetical protein
MSDAPILTFDALSKLGKVASVDTSRVLIAVENAALLPVLLSEPFAQGRPLRGFLSA